MSCQRAYEVELAIPGLKIVRSVIFTQRKSAKQFQAKQRPGATLAVVELCDGVIKRRGKRRF